MDTTTPVRTGNEDWTPDSWRNCPIRQVPSYPDEAKLAENAQVFTHISTHNAYHIGQIIYVRKEQGSWDPKNGVK